MESTNHVDFGHALAKRLVNYGHDLIGRLFKCVRVAFFCRESTELTGENTDVGIIDVTVVDVGRGLSILLLTDRRCHNPERVQIVRTIKR